ncbi:hypothetical protein BG910_01745 [Neisseria chenwenguii]|uniref:Transporter n=1 Tax=Neisseria chenwenguii TaxID=1853278 RepID=A0A220RZK5_9NEIS|nr:TolC family protein [Neisseria chenwenguii]ASK26634.1 hypothetical protein BG910_01745 [Neisseria chenwenguii]
MLRPTRLTAVLATALSLAACQHTAVPQSTLPVPQKFDQAEAARGSAEIAQWWRQWNDPVLSRLIERGLQQNFDVLIAQGRLNEARSNADLARADLGPTAGAKASAGRMVSGRADNPLSNGTRAAAARFTGSDKLSGDDISFSGNNYQAALSASWEPDIFGKKRSDADAARYAALGMQEQVYGTQVLVAAEIADNYFQARAAQGRLKNAQRTVAVLRRMKQYADARFRAGQTTAYETNEAASRLSAAQAVLPALEAQYAVRVRNLAVLTGQVPQNFSLPSGRADILANQPQAPAGQTPQGLIERRPDLRAHAAQISAYAAKLASAKADLLPRFSIDFLSQGIRISGDTALQSWGNLLSAGIRIPLFTNGRVKANVAAADARLQTALLQYDQTLLKALGETDNAYQTHAALVRQNRQLAEAHRLAAKEADDAEKLFKHGQKTLDTALTARLRETEVRDNRLQTELAQAQTLLGLYKALGGGWTAKQAV